MNSETSEKLVKYLIKHVLFIGNGKCVCMEIVTTRDIAHSKLLDIEVLLSQESRPRYAEPQ